MACWCFLSAVLLFPVSCCLSSASLHLKHLACCDCLLQLLIRQPTGLPCTLVTGVALLPMFQSFCDCNQCVLSTLAERQLCDQRQRYHVERLSTSGVRTGRCTKYLSVEGSEPESPWFGQEREWWDWDARWVEVCWVPLPSWGTACLENYGALLCAIHLHLGKRLRGGVSWIVD